MEKEKKLLFWMVLISMFVVFIFTSDMAQAAEKTFKWRLAAGYESGQPLYKESPAYFANLVKKMSGGRLQVQTFPAGAIVPAMEITESVRKGVAQMGAVWPGWDIGVDRTTVLLGGFAGSLDPQQMVAWLYSEGGLELWKQFRREKFQVIGFPGGFYGTETFIHSHKPINSLADVKGLKVRCAGAWAEILPKLGASTVTLPGAEVYPALERKVIDATEWTTPGGDLVMGFHDVTKYVIVPGAHQPSAPFELQVNLKAWEELPDDLKAIVESAAMNATINCWLKHTSLDVPALDKYRKHGNIVQYLPVEVQVEVAKWGMKWADDHATKNPWFKKVWESQKNYLKVRREFDKVMTLKFE
jgi:TRAP-type mannitol/chloroaromatic compound transport system substrate-binding protein